MQTPRNFLVRFQVYNDKPSFGKGIVMLMTRIQNGHSLKSAAEDMGMAYSKAWLHFKKAEADLGINLISKKAGGVGGGGTHVTEEGARFLARYMRFEALAREAVQGIFEQCFHEASGTNDAN
jgi:molybdate transport system regulatory protein